MSQTAPMISFRKTHLNEENISESDGDLRKDEVRKRSSWK